MTHPYESLEQRYFWSTAVAKRNMFDIKDLWDPRFRLRKRMKVATFGSCFAQHIGRSLRERGFNWFIAEPAPVGLSAENSSRFNYGIFSARTGNIYTVSLLEQWVDWATGVREVPTEVWVNDGRYYDPFRPSIEPNGFDSESELNVSRQAALKAFRSSLVDSQVFVFTLGLTESWINQLHGYEYPMCPGTLAGEFNTEEHKFFNQGFLFIQKTLVSTIKKIRKLNPTLRFILTVSPVPLTATMSGNHVLLATIESKSILRSVAGSLVRKFPYVDYFPSYEIINSAPFRGTFFESNQRSVNHAGVSHVMDTFFECLRNKFGVEDPQLGPGTQRRLSDKKQKGSTVHDTSTANPCNEDVVCEEALLNAFSK